MVLQSDSEVFEIGSRKKVFFFFTVARPLRGGGGKGLATTKTNFFRALKNPPENMATKLEGSKASGAGPLKKITFFTVSLSFIRYEPIRKQGE